MANVDFYVRDAGETAKVIDTVGESLKEKVKFTLGIMAALDTESAAVHKNIKMGVANLAQFLPQVEKAIETVEEIRRTFETLNAESEEIGAEPMY